MRLSMMVMTMVLVGGCTEECPELQPSMICVPEDWTCCPELHDPYCTEPNPASGTEAPRCEDGSWRCAGPMKLVNGAALPPCGDLPDFGFPDQQAPDSAVEGGADDGA